MKQDSMINFVIRVIVIPVIIILFLGAITFSTFVGASRVSEAINDLSSAVEVCAAELSVEEAK